MNGSAASCWRVTRFSVASAWVGEATAISSLGQERLAHERHRRLFPASTADGEVDLVGRQSLVQVLPVADVQSQVDLRVELAERAEQVREDVDPDRGVTGDAQGPAPQAA